MNVAFFREVRSHKVRLQRLQTGVDGPVPLWERVAFALYPNLGRPLLNLDELASLHLYGGYLAACGQPHRERMQQCTALQKEVEYLPLYRSFLTRMLTPVMERVFQSCGAREATLGLTWYAAELKLYRYAHGRYPAALADLAQPGSHLPTDPFNDQPYHYRLEGKGFRLWSVGTNAVDDGGDDSDSRAGNHPPGLALTAKDLVFLVTR